MSDTHEVVRAGLDLGLTQHVAKLFSVLMADDPTSTQRFERGLEKAIAAYDEAVAIAGKLPYRG